MTKNPEVIVVCFANYCRSPVAEKLLQKKFNRIIFQSAGIAPVPEANMDPRSINFLKSKGINETTHMPKSINDFILKNSRHVFALDMFVLMELNKRYGSQSKFKLLNFKKPSLQIYDPYKMNDHGYIDIMNKIESVVNIISEEDLL